jgi:glucosyl-dolichyl phosphate glucuronosyltransferase
MGVAEGVPERTPGVVVEPTQRDPTSVPPQPAPTPADLSVVICAYTLDRWDQIVDAVASVLRQVPAVREVILVADHNDELARRARAELAGIAVVENSEVRGLSGARNSGVRAATGRVIAFLDDDATAEPGWAAALCGAYTDPDVIGVGGRSEPRWLAQRPAWFPEEFDWVIGCSYRGLPERSAPVRNMIGSNMSFRGHVFDAVGAFDPRVGRVGANPVGCEETEFCIRAVRALPGSRILYVPAARVRHTVPPDRGSWRYFRSRCFAEGRSKAEVTRLAGARSGLASERRYTARVLPAGMLGRVRQAVRERRVAPLGAAGAIGAGLVLTGAGYLRGLLEKPRLRTGAPAALAPADDEGLLP